MKNPLFRSRIEFIRYENEVGDMMECPYCGERDADKLEVVDADEGVVICHSCETEYNGFDGTSDRDNPNGSIGTAHYYE